MATKEQWEIIKSDFLRGNVDRFKNDLNFKGQDITADFIMQNAALSGYDITPEQRTELAQTAASAYQAKYGTVAGGRERTATDFGGSMAAVNAAYPVAVASQAQIDNPANYAPQVAQPGQPIKQYVPNEAALQAIRIDLGKQGITTSEWNKYISSPDAQGKIYYTPPASKTNGSITPANLTPVSATTLPSGNLPDTSTADAVVASAPAMNKSFQDYVNERTLPLTDTQKKEQSLGDMMASLTGDATQRGADQLSAEQAAGIAAMKENVNNITSQIDAKKLEYEAYKQQQQGKPITMSSITGSIAQKQSEIASDILLLQAQGMMYQGKLDTAQATVNRAIDLKYQSIDARYKIAEAQLAAIRPQLTREENIRADALQAMYDDQKQKIADQKAADKVKENAKLDNIDQTNKLAQDGYNYVATPAERDKLRGLGYSILEQTDANGVKRTYAKPPAPVKASGGGGRGGGRGGDGGGDDGTSDFDFAKQIIQSNPNATPEELKVGLLEQVSLGKIKLSVTEINSLIDERKQKAKAETEANKPQSFTQDWFKSKIVAARSNDFSNTEIIDYIIKNFDVNELFKTAKEAGYAKWYSGKKTDIKRYIESLL